MSYKLNSVLRLNSRQSGNCKCYKLLDILSSKPSEIKILQSVQIFKFLLVDFERQYDSGLSRLIVQPWDNWKGISPSGMSTDFNPDPPIFAAKFANVENYSHILALANEDGRVSVLIVIRD